LIHKNYYSTLVIIEIFSNLLGLETNGEVLLVNNKKSEDYLRRYIGWKNLDIHPGKNA